jgi:hypothetical protein
MSGGQVSAVAVLVVVALILLAVSPMWLWQPRWNRWISAPLTGLVVGLAVSLAGQHKCQEGGPPWVIVLGVAGLAAAGPFLVPLRRGLLPACLLVVTSIGMATTAHLARSYHRPEITGNPAYSAGRFWHTPFTGQYPRAAKPQTTE